MRIQLTPIMKKGLLLTLLSLTVFSFKAQDESEDPNELQSLTALVQHIERLYVDSVERKALVEDAIVGMLEELDPHSSYIPAEELKRMNEPLKGNFEGVGIRFQILEDTIFVVSPISGGPSEKVGIMAGDRIVSVDDENVGGIGIQNSDVQRLLKGPKGTKVEVGISRRGEKSILDFEITRDKIPIYSVDASYMIDDITGYVKINRFAATTIEEFQESLSELKGQGMENLILDLQGNGGGYLRSAIEIADEFLSQDQLIVFTEGRSFPRRDVNASSRGGFEKGNLAVLIDEGSASASEIVSGAVQDWDRGLVIGRRSFGKGLVQKPVNLPNGGVVRLTTQEYFTPAGRCIQKPYDEGSEEYRKEKYDRLDSGELTDADSVKVDESQLFYTRLNKREVYGGGGIVPDIFVPIDTTMGSDYYRQLVRKGIMNRHVLSYVNDERKSLSKNFPDVDTFIDSFHMDERWFKDFFEYAEQEEVEYDEEGYLEAKELIDLRLKAMIARNLFDSSAFYKIMNPLFPTYQKAMEVMQDDTFQRLNLAQNQ